MPNSLGLSFEIFRKIFTYFRKYVQKDTNYFLKNIYNCQLEIIRIDILTFACCLFKNFLKT